MSKPFQFSMARMFAFVTLFCIGAAVYGHAIHHGMHGNLNFLEVAAGGAIAGCGVGLIVRRPPIFLWVVTIFLCVVIGSVVALASVFVILLALIMMGAHS